ncbi:hypothetical protein JVT61DRAFT_110 [Boletus reticuloceps]|uniref:Uncharacterized protein n=1 Tax=Boletus reticuloceps TaxID=495285 RepID=A0A8I2Z0H1_9AGAM|nr:hypothetical protein JVT61DRAFT_110 [Boletus reticuloceps]
MYIWGDPAGTFTTRDHQDNSYIFHLAQQFRNGSGRPQAQDHRSSIARASDNFLAQGSSIFSDGHSSPRRRSTLDYQSSIPLQSNHQRDTRPPSRKRRREALDDASYHVKEEDDNTHPSSLPTTNTCHLPKPRITVPSQALSSSSIRIPASLNTHSHACEHESRLRPDERCMPKHISNKRVHRSSEDLVRQESAILSMPTTWSIPDDQVIKGTKKPGEAEEAGISIQCARRRMKCEYPTESRRGQHKRRRKPVEGESAGQSTARTNSMSVVALTTTTSSSTTSTPSA